MDQPGGLPHGFPEGLASLVDSLDCILYEMDAETFRLTYVSGNVERMLGYPADEWLTQPTFLVDHIHPEERERVLAYCQAETAAGRNHQLEYRMVAADGTVRWFREVVTVAMEAERAKTLRGAMIDISDRKQAEQLLAEREQHSRLVIETAHDAFIAIDADSRVTDWTRQAERILGWSRAEAIGRPMPELIIPPRLREAHWQGLNRVLRSGTDPGLPRLIQTTALHRDGHEFPVEITVSVLQEQGQPTFNAFVRDITRRKEGEDELQRLNADLQALARRLLRVQEEGRQRAANDLHDGALQMIATAQMYFETLVAKIGPVDPVLIDGVREYLALAVDECRNVIATIRPGLLQDLGLVEGLRRYVDELSRRSAQRIEFHPVGPDGKLDDAIGSNLFRIVHEAVANATRHSGSDRVLVTLKRTSRRLTVQVRDWGCGFDVRATQPLSQGGQHIGLRVMEERAALVGGRFSLVSAPGEGTTVAVHLTLPADRRSPSKGNPANRSSTLVERGRRPRWLAGSSTER